MREPDFRWGFIDAGSIGHRFADAVHQWTRGAPGGRGRPQRSTVPSFHRAVVPVRRTDRGRRDRDLGPLDPGTALNHRFELTFAADDPILV